MANSNLHMLSARGQSVWIDSLSRQMLESGGLTKLMEEDVVVGVTTNPTIFQKAISQGDDYDEQLKELLDKESDPKEIFLQLSAQDVVLGHAPSIAPDRQLTAGALRSASRRLASRAAP